MTKPHFDLLPENPQIYWTKELSIPHKGINYEITLTKRDFVTLKQAYNNRPCDIVYTLTFDPNQIPNVDKLKASVIPHIADTSEELAIQKLRDFIDMLVDQILESIKPTS